MRLTDEEKGMLDGIEGPAVAAAMDLLVRYGEALGCGHLCDVRNVAGTMTQLSPVRARLVAEVGWDRAFAVINLDCDDYFEIPPMRVATCGTIPVRGEHCAWMESSAVIYANSVLGARTNCEGAASTGAASLTGKVPCWGNHLDGNRYGTHLIDVAVRVDDFAEWGMLGYFAGRLAGEERPVITGDIGRPDLAGLKHFGAAAATSGGVELYHIPGITPEAPTEAAAFGPAPVPDAVRYGADQRRAVYEDLNSQGTSADVDFVLLGCAHASVDQIRQAARALDGRHLSPGTQLWLMVPRALKVIADRSGCTDIIERAGGKVLADSCPAISRVPPLGTRVFATDSARQAHYLPAILGVAAWFGTLDECVDAAVTGRWRGHLRPPGDLR
jgi:predicted aconitase